MKPCARPTAGAAPVPVFRDAPDFHFQVARLCVRIQHAKPFAQLVFRVVGRAEGRAVDIAVAISAGERNLPTPAMLEGSRNGLRWNVVADRCRHRDRRIVEEVVREAHEGRSERLLDQNSGEAGAIDENIGRHRIAVFDRYGRDLAALVQLHARDMAFHIFDPALQRLFVKVLAEQHRIEVISIPDVERKRPDRFRGEVVVGEVGRDEEAVRMRAHIGTVQARLRVVHELCHRQVVEHRGKRMEIALESRLGRPAVECDAAFVRRVALGHPLGLLDPEAVEEASQPRRGSFADTDDADHGRLEDRNLDAVPDQCIRQDHCGHPPGRSPADDDNLPDGRRDVRRFIGLLERVRIIEKRRGRRSIGRCGHSFPGQDDAIRCCPRGRRVGPGSIDLLLTQSGLSGSIVRARLVSTQ